MLELRRFARGLVGCHARPEALDTLGVGQLGLRVAPGELQLLCAPGQQEELAALAGERLAALDPGALVVDVSDGYGGSTLRGSDRFELFGRLCAIPPPDPPAQILGLFAHVPARILVEQEELHVIVSSSLAHYLRARILGAAADLEPCEASEAALPAAAVGQGG